MVYFNSPEAVLENTLEKINNYLNHYRKSLEDIGLRKSRDDSLKRIEELERDKVVYEEAIMKLKL